jgi:hypothetical protein
MMRSSRYDLICRFLIRQTITMISGPLTWGSLFTILSETFLLLPTIYNIVVYGENCTHWRIASFLYAATTN